MAALHMNQLAASDSRPENGPAILGADREFALQRACDLVALMQWLEEARTLAEALYQSASTVPELQAMLRHWEIPSAPDWTEAHSVGLHTLLDIQRDLIARAGGFN